VSISEFHNFSLCISWTKTKLQSVGSDSGPELHNIMVDTNPIEQFKSSISVVSVMHCSVMDMESAVFE